MEHNDKDKKPTLCAKISAETLLQRWQAHNRHRSEKQQNLSKQYNQCGTGKLFL